MYSIRNKHGFTIFEATITMFIFTMIFATTASMWIGSVRSYDRSTVRTYTDIDAATALQRMVYDVREAKQVDLLDINTTTNIATRLSILLPETDSDGNYNRHEVDSASEIQYYLSDNTGIVGHIGSYLWRTQKGIKNIIKKDVVEIGFESDTPRSIKITIATENTKMNRENQRTELTQRVVYLRNH